VTVELDPKAAPLHVKSFLYLTSIGFYDGTFFHRWVDFLGDGKGYIIQGGDPLTKNPATLNHAGEGGPGYQIPREYNGLKHDKLVIAAARGTDPNSASSQFYITQGEVYTLDGDGGANEGYTVFGKVVAGQDAAMKLRRGTEIVKATILK
jgi:cyclophilin family peptidyl-prolyl cis-trans isomerase